jgi:hypothetical protein
MAYAPYTIATRNIIAEIPARTRPGFFRWLATAMIQSRRRQVEREIARYLGNGKFTDEIEREIERRFLSTSSRF